MSSSSRTALPLSNIGVKKYEKIWKSEKIAKNLKKITFFRKSKIFEKYFFVAEFFLEMLSSGSSDNSNMLCLGREG